MVALQTSVRNNKLYQSSGYLGGAGAAISWTATALASIAKIAGIPYGGDYDVYSGSLQSLAELFSSTIWSNNALLSIGAPDLTTGLGIWGGFLNTTVTETISYNFSSPVPAGASFMLVDPGASYPEYSGTERFSISATYKGVAVSTSGWTFSIQSPTSGTVPGSSLTINSAAGTITVNSYNSSAWPDDIVVITPNTPISNFTVTAQTIPFDFWALTLPHIPAALVFETGNAAPNYSCAIDIWQINGLSVTGGGGVSNPGSAWFYAGTGDFQGEGGTSILFRNENGILAYWALSGTSITAVGTMGSPGGTWSVIGVGDFNGDGRSDILFEDGSGNLGMWEMNGASIVASGSLYSLSTSWRYLATADFNGDGYSDILFENANGILAEWLMNGMSVARVVTLGVAPSGSVFAGVGDFNGDGVADILFKNPTLGQYSAWLMSSSGAVSSTVTLCTPGIQNALVSIGAYTTASASDLIFDNTTSGALTAYDVNNAAVTNVGALGAPGANFWVATAPYALPPLPPTIYFSDSSGDLTLWSIPYGADLGSATFSSALSGWTFLAGGDFDGYGRPDYLLENASGSFAVWETNGSQIVGAGSFSGPGGTWTYKGVGDFNGDGIEDILFADASGDYASWLLNGASVIGGAWLGNFSTGHTLAAIADITGNGTSDLIFEDASGNYGVWFYANDALVGSTPIGNPGPGYTLLGTGDFNGGGRDDLLFAGASNTYKTWDLNGGAIVGGGTFSGPGVAWSYFGVAELGGNGCASILFRNASTGVIMADNMFDATVASTTIIGTPAAGFSPLAVI
jgi:hypothetical protein